MKFKTEEIDSFFKIFRESQPLIKNCEGCNDVKLYQDKMDHSTLFTISYWDNQESLEKYRKSDLFKTTWARTKVLFDGKPEAWSLEEAMSDER